VAIDWAVSALYPTEIFWRQLHHGDFDVSEMSLSSLMIAVSRGNRDWIGLPIFTGRRFFHTGIMIRKGLGIEKPADLAGKRVGVPEYQQTAALWTRGVLRDEFALEPSSMEWHMERNPEQSHGGATGFSPPAGIRLSYVPHDKSLGRMLVDGELDALIHFTPGQNLIDRTTVNPLTDPNVERLFDPAAEAQRYFSKTGIYPTNHCVVIRRSIAESDPWVVLNIFNAFVAAKKVAHDELLESAEPYATSGGIDENAMRALRRDMYPYGLESSRRTLEAISRYLYQDGLVKKPVVLEDVFSKHFAHL
jgi:4,5-dihydroxyphthalate decarboxylase